MRFLVLRRVGGDPESRKIEGFRFRGEADLVTSRLIENKRSATKNPASKLNNPLKRFEARDIRVEMHGRPWGSISANPTRKRKRKWKNRDQDEFPVDWTKRMMEEASKLFQLPGTIEEEEEEQRGVESQKLRKSLDNARSGSPLLGPKSISVPSNLTRNVTLIRVSTQSSSIAGGITRQDSTR